MGITSYEKQYMDILMKIYHDGYEDGVTYSDIEYQSFLLH